MSEDTLHEGQHPVATDNPNENENKPSEPTESTTTATTAPTPKKRRGFAVMDPKRVSEIASKGGKAAHAAGTAHEFSREEAREAGRKGGYATHARRKAKTGEGAPNPGG
jgi:general stress protein YciG